MRPFEKIEVHEHPHGRASIVHVNLSGDGAATHVKFLAEGMSADQVRAKVDAIEAHHRAKAERHTRFNALDRHLTVAGGDFFLHGLAIVEQGTDVRLVCRVQTSDGAMLELDDIYASVADVPSDSEIVRRVRSAAVDWNNHRKMATDHVKSVRKALGLNP